jgi:hypothetical protein
MVCLSFAALIKLQTIKNFIMGFKILGTLAISLLVITGCKNSGNQQGTDGGQETPTQQAPAGSNQSMPGQMQQPADIDVSTKEIQQFVSAAQSIQGINQEAQQKVGKAVEDEGMSQRRFSEIRQSQQSQNQGQANATEEEMEQYRNIMQTLQNMRTGMRDNMENAIKQSGLTMQRYQQIAKAAQTDTALMKRIQQKLQSSMSNQ